MTTTRSLLEQPWVPEFLRDFQEEHLSELSFLLAQRRRHLHNHEVEWPDIESLEVRILRHSEAMQAGGEAAITCVREALASEVPETLTAGIHVIASFEAGLPEMLARMEEVDEALLPHFTEALTLVRTTELSERLGALLSSRIGGIEALSRGAARGPAG